MCGINVFKRVINLFNKNFKILYPHFAKMKGIDISKKSKHMEQQLKLMHREYIQTMEKNWNDALKRDRDAKRPIAWIDEKDFQW